jgi:pimeloyl-ACP methyl ester carboxylesterase
MMRTRWTTAALVGAAFALGVLAPVSNERTASAGEERGAVSFAVEFETEDGFAIHGDLVSAASAESPVAILLHQYRADRTSWAALVDDLVAHGITVLAIDQRAHGESVRRGAETVRVREIPRSRFGDVVRAGVWDVAAARRFLAERGIAVDRIGLVGASYGCSVALLAANEVEGVRALVLLSPGVAYFGVPVLESARRFPGPVLAVAAEDDPRSAEAVYSIAGPRAPPSARKVFERGGHGTRLLATQPGSIAEIRRFLLRTLQPEAGS